MKKLINKIIRMCVNFLRWVWAECRDWRTFVLLVIVCVIIGTPVWGGLLLYAITKWTWALAVAGTSWAFWMIPGVPFFTISVTITLAIKKIYQTVRKHKGKVDAEKAEATEAVEEERSDK